MSKDLEPFEGKAVMAINPPASAAIIVYEGAVRSSKTTVSLQWWVAYLRSAPSGNMIMIGVTIDTVIRNLLMPLQELYGANRITWSRGTGTASILGRSVHIMGASDVRSFSKIQGLTLRGAYVDELTNMREDFFDMLTSRMSEKDAKIIATCNPEGPKHWLLVKYLRRCKWWIKGDGTRQFETDDVLIDGKPVERMPWMRITFLIDDNHHLCRTNPTYVENIKKSKTGVFHRRMILAEWVTADGMVYDQFDPDKHTIPLEHLPTIERVLSASLDYGQNHDTRGHLLGLGQYQVNVRTGLPRWKAPDSKDPHASRYGLFVLAEYAPAAQMTVGAHASGFEAFLKAHDHWGDPEWIFVDPAALAFKTEMWARGHTNAVGAHNKVLPGIQTVQGLLATGGLFIVAENCPDLIDMIPAYMWSVKAAERGVTAVLKENDDSADSARYSIFSTRAAWRQYISLAPVGESELEQAA